MTDVYLRLKDGEWEECDKEHAYKDVQGNRFSLNVMLKQRLDRLTKLVDDKWDGMFIIDGRERSGKSSLATACGWYLTRGNFGVNNFASGLKDCAEKIEKLPDKSVMIMDEGSTMFGSKDSTGKAQKQLIKILDVVGQKNMIFIVCLPCFFDLNKTIAVRRSLFLIHVKAKELKDTWKREPFYYYDEKAKAMLYRIGKKNYDSYSKPYPTFAGKYYQFEPPFWSEYENIIKKASLQEVIDLAKQEKSGRGTLINEREAKLHHYLVTQLGWQQTKIANIIGTSHPYVSERVRLHKKILQDEATSASL